MATPEHDIPTERPADEGLSLTAAYLADRLAQIREALEPTPFVTYCAPSNAPGDPLIFSPDFRDRLHPDDPYANQGGPRVVYGTPEAVGTFQIMHDALMLAMLEEAEDEQRSIVA